jgi:hypothetical protein
MNIFNSSPAYSDDERSTGAEPLSPERAQIVDRHLARTDAALRRAYARGRRDERARRRGLPVGSGLLLLVALAGLFVVALSVYEGSFTRGGQVVDQHITSATQAASRATRQATDKAADAMRDAGDKLKRSAG